MESRIIYALIDPRNNLVFYVGQTKNIERRMRFHYADGGLNRKSPIHDAKYTYWHAMEKAGFKPTIEILDVVDISEVRQIEWEWAFTLKLLGHPITNRLKYMIKGKKELIQEELRKIAA